VTDTLFWIYLFLFYYVLKNYSNHVLDSFDLISRSLEVYGESHVRINFKLKFEVRNLVDI